MAHSSFDPLHNDPFAEPPFPATAPAPPTTLAPVANHNQPGNQWSLQQNHVQSPETAEDILLQFNNKNDAASPNGNIRKKRSNSIASASSLGSRSARSGLGYVLGNPDIAPPPEMPVPKDYSLSMFHAEAELIPTAPPDFDKIKHSGFCLARISMRTLVLKKWKQIFWIVYGDNLMLFFKTKELFEDWLMNPHLSRHQRNKLVKLRINFDQPNKSSKRPQETIKGFQASMVKAKNYKSCGYLHQFKLDKWTPQGPTIAAAFGSNNPESLREMHMIMAELLRRSPTSAAVAAFVDPRDGDDSSGYFSVGSNPTFARPSEDGSQYSGYSTRSATSGGSKNYIVNSFKSAGSR